MTSIRTYLTGILLLVSFGLTSLANADSRPNILFIAVDDLNDWVGHLGGHPQAETPNIDRLAQRGIAFTRAYCSAPLCNPSRVSLLTGIEPSKSGVYGNGEKFREKLPYAVTLMQYLRNMVIRWRVGVRFFTGPTGQAIRHRWDFYFKAHAAGYIKSDRTTCRQRPGRRGAR